MLDARRAWSLFPLAMIVGVSLFAIGFWLLTPLSLPAPEDTVAAAKAIHEGFAPGDAVAVRPWWAARIREGVGDLPFVQVRDLGAEDLSRFSRLWVVLLPGHARELGGPFLDGRYPLEESREIGRLTLRRYRLPAPVRVLYDFREHLHQATVRMTQGGAMKECGTWSRDRWVCTPRDWNYVGRMIVELGDDPREVIWAHPSDTGPLQIAYAGIPGGRTLLIHTGFTPPAARVAEGVPVTLEVLVDGQSQAKIVTENRTGYFPHEVDLSSLGPGPHEVIFKVSAPNVGMRHFCFDAEVRA